MIKGFLEQRKINKAIRQWQNSELGKALILHTDEYFKYPRLAEFSEENKTKIKQDFLEKIFSFSDAENPFLAMREALAAYVIGYTQYQVLCLKEEEKEAASYSDCPYISGELYKHIDKVTEHFDALGELKWKHPDIPSEDLIDFCNTKCVIHLYYVNGLNYVRMDFDDLDKEKDWLQPFIKSSLIHEENYFRDKIGLPSLLPDSMDGVKHGTFMNVVIQGHKNPYYEWEKHWSVENGEFT